MCAKCLRFHILDKISFQLFVPQDMYRNTSRFSVFLALNILLSALTTSRCVEDLQKHLNAHLSCLLIKCPVIFLKSLQPQNKGQVCQITNFVYAPVKIMTILTKSKLWSIEEEDSARWTIQLGNVMVTEGMEFEFRRFTFSFPTRNSAIEPHFLCLGNFNKR